MHAENVGLDPALFAGHSLRADARVLLCGRPDRRPRAPHEHARSGHGAGQSRRSGRICIRELAETVITLTRASSRIVHMPVPADDPRQRRPDISKANELLDWRPTVPLREGLVTTIAYFERLLKNQLTNA
jgi:hypothetical protein